VENEIILEWDDDKRQKVMTERQIDFADAIEVLTDQNVAIHTDDRCDYGETRMNAFGISKGRHLRVCFTPRDDKIRIITMNKVGKKEWGKYYEKND
jgi:uncharacterized DUF497 family protein